MLAFCCEVGYSDYRNWEVLIRKQKESRMHIKCTVSKSGLCYRGVTTVRNDDNVVIDQKLSSHEHLIRIDALRDAEIMRSHYEKFSQFA